MLEEGEGSEGPDVTGASVNSYIDQHMHAMQEK